MTLDFRQIHWKDEQLPAMYPFATPYRNETLSPYFENSVIAELVPQSTADLIGIASWRLKEKRNESSTPGILTRATGNIELSEEKILSYEFDVAILTPRNNLHNMLNAAAGYHGASWAEAFPVFARGFVRGKLGIRLPEFPDKLTHTIYENHFIAKRDLYHEYVETCLKPAIDFMEGEPVFMIDDGMNYLDRKPAHMGAEYRALTGRQQYPIAPFILERLFSIWIERKNLKVIPL